MMNVPTAAQCEFEIVFLRQRIRDLESRPCPNVVTSDEGTSYCALAEGRIRELEAELAASRETNSRLNRRCQQYERGLAEKLAENKGPSLGRALANAAAEMCEQRAEAAEKRIRELEAECVRLWEFVQAFDAAHALDAKPGSWDAMLDARAVLEKRP